MLGVGTRLQQPRPTFEGEETLNNGLLNNGLWKQTSGSALGIKYCTEVITGVRERPERGTRFVLGGQERIAWAVACD